MYHKIKTDAGISKKGSHIFFTEDQASILIEAGKIEKDGHEVNPDEKEVTEKPVKQPKVSSTKDTIE